MNWLIDNLLDLALSIAEYISQAVYTLVQCIFYPIELIFCWIGNILKLIINSFIGLFDSLWNIFDMLYIFSSNTLNSLFPNIWTTIILLGLTIVFLLRLYYFIKDISILGNKI